MRKISFSLMLTIVLLITCSFRWNEQEDKIRILLMGDSTTAGGRGVLDTSIERLLATTGIPAEVINVGLGGDTAYELINSGRYDSEIKDIENIDYIFFRYGINDYNPGKAHRKNRPFEEYFKIELRDAISQVQKGFPKAEIIMMNIVPWRGEEIDALVNNDIALIAKEKNLELFDLHTLYLNKEEELGQYSLRTRFVPLDILPEQYHELLKPYTNFVKWKDTDMVRVNTNEFDPVFGHISQWYKDPHPNTPGYRFIADETVKFLIPRIESRK